MATTQDQQQQQAVDLNSAISTPVTGSSGLASSVSTTATSTCSANSSGVPDFTEFKLNPFHLTADSGTPAPHRLREARRSLALYLEPCKGTEFQTSLETFQEQSFSKFGPNQAHNASPHVSVLGRVHIERGQEFLAKWHAVDEFISVVNQELDATATQLPPPSFCGYEITERPSRALTMRFRVDPAYAQLAKRIEHKMKSQCAAFDIRPMDRIDLAYNVLRPMPKQTLKSMRDMAKETIQVEIGGAWQLTLYEVMLESRVVGVKQQVSAIQSWPVRQPPAEKQSSSFLPMSFRIKLAMLSSWLQWNPASSSSTVNPNKRIEYDATNKAVTA
ncbi:hypothetical protein BDB00DRAFT_834907 [Zychaea mexicana]|uniref:uncharacterized protein n=1 Tax=Zychaea mexicana TaxID=64656 RepID=UPI0022FF2B75|nr:uncharacterized protein BDB00DRAFT_834907 [Zychaea mexicana]KAI9491036.1 hypothetical protein BDB00DRAFT_834907 [Zychaea mexicana]